MNPNPDSELTDNQQAMLDLALACDLRVSDPATHPVMKSRHHNIKTREAAAEYIMEVEGKIHSRRKQGPMKKSKTPPRQWVPK